MIDLIIDLGAHDGIDLPYYLSRAKRVIAVEANPVLANGIKTKYQDEVSAGRLVVIDRVISVEGDGSQEVGFFIDPLDPGKSCIATEEQVIAGRNIALIRSVALKQIFNKYGRPDYLKIDLEGYDQKILQWLGKNPEYWPVELSFERVKPPFLDAFLRVSPYRYFNIVSFYNFEKIYGGRGGKTAGPFGIDIRSPWMEREEFTRAYAAMPYHWFDIHAVEVVPQGTTVGPFDLRWYSVPFALTLKKRLWMARRWVGGLIGRAD